MLSYAGLSGYEEHFKERHFCMTAHSSEPELWVVGSRPTVSGSTRKWFLQWGKLSIKVWSFHFYKGIADECSGCHLDFFFVLGTCTLRLGRSSNSNTTLCLGRVKEVLRSVDCQHFMFESISVSCIDCRDWDPILFVVI